MSETGGRPIALILHGPSGVGKDSIIAGLRAAIGIRRATSTTDRAPRPGERDGIDYYFVTTQEFERRIDAGVFAEHAFVYEQWKGLQRIEVEGPIGRGKDVIIRTDVQGARSWRDALEGAVSVVIVPDDPTRPVDEHRSLTRARILDRDPRTPECDLQKRLDELEAELADIPNNDYVVVNPEGGLEAAIDQLVAIISTERARPERPTPRFRC